jgi:tRNA(Ile)-lysidine synthase
VIRPLLEVSRAEIEEYLNEKDLTSRLDHSNQDLSFLRNWIRLKLIPQLKEKMDRNLPSRLAQQAELIREEEIGNAGAYCDQRNSDPEGMIEILPNNKRCTTSSP